MFIKKTRRYLYISRTMYFPPRPTSEILEDLVTQFSEQTEKAEQLHGQFVQQKQLSEDYIRHLEKELDKEFKIKKLTPTEARQLVHHNLKSVYRKSHHYMETVENGLIYVEINDSEFVRKTKMILGPLTENIRSLKNELKHLAGGDLSDQSRDNSDESRDTSDESRDTSDESRGTSDNDSRYSSDDDSRETSEEDSRNTYNVVVTNTRSKQMDQVIKNLKRLYHAVLILRAERDDYLLLRDAI